MMQAAPMPISARKPITCSVLDENAAAADAEPKITSPSTSAPRRP